MKEYMTLSDEDKNSILQQHSTFYNGYATGNVPSGSQPLRVDNGPSDTQGINVNNKGEVSTYKNHMVNESIEEEVMEYEADLFDIESSDLKQSEGNVDFPPEFGDEMSDWSDLEPFEGDLYNTDIDKLSHMFDGLHEYESDDSMDDELYEEEEVMEKEMTEKETCEQCGGEMREGECMECGGMYEEVDDNLKESFIEEKQRISEMFDRFKKFN